MSLEPTNEAGLRVSFVDAVKGYVANAGLVATDDQIAGIDAVMRALGTHTLETGEYAFLMNTGADGSAVEFLKQATAGLPKAPKPTAVETGSPSEWVKVRNGGSAAYYRHDDPMLAIISGIRGDDSTALAAEAATWPNPFRAGPTFNRTRATILSKVDPQRAARLKAEATA